jgi:hypothetical protein
MDNLDNLRMIFTIIIISIFILLGILVVVYFSTKDKKEKKIGKSEKISTGGEEKAIPKSKTFAVQSVIDFMEFDRIEDNMIIQKDGFKYIMVIECQGINYDLMSEVEKVAVEEGFIQFLNTIRHPVQLYVQTRTINLENSLEGYRARVKQIEDDYNKQEMRYREMKSSGNYTKEQLDQVYYELTKQRNLTEYGKDIIYSTEKMSLNKNVLNQSYYVVVPYIPEDSGTDDFDKDEITNMAFSELYTRCQSIIRTLAGCEVNGRILTSEELVELLYVAYNRDEQEVFGLDKALRAGYDELYSTGEDVLDKKMRMLDEKIEEQAFNKANEKVIEAQSAKEKALQKKENNMDNLIDNLAKLIIEQNTASVGYDVAQDAINSINKEKAERNAGKKNVSKEGGTKEDGKEKTKRRRTTKTA